MSEPASAEPAPAVTDPYPASQDTATTPATIPKDTASDSATMPPSPPPPPSILHKSTSNSSHEAAGSATSTTGTSPQHHVRIAGAGSSIPHISPRSHHHHKDRNSLSSSSSSLKNISHSPRFPRKDRSMSLGAYPPSWANLSANNNAFAPPPPPLSPYYSSSPSASPIPINMMFHDSTGGTAAAGATPSTTTCMPFMPNLSQTPGGSAAMLSGPTRAAVDAAVHKERERTKQKEKEEVDMTEEELRSVLKRERLRMSKIQADLAAMRAAAVQSQADAEVHEEGRINSLMRRVECLQQEKGRIIIELEREEEMLTNTLQKKLNEVKREKWALEQQIEREQLSHTDLKSKLTSLRQTKPTTSTTTSGDDDNDESESANVVSKTAVHEGEATASSLQEKDSIHSLPASIPESEDEDDEN